MNHLPLFLIFIIIAVESIYAKDFTTTLVEFDLPCDGIICHDDLVSSFITQLEEITGCRVEFVSIWGEEVSLLFCGCQNLTEFLNQIATNSVGYDFSGVSVGKIQWMSEPCPRTAMSFIPLCYFDTIPGMGCCFSVPPENDNWIGTWEGEGVFLKIGEDGKFTYNGPEGPQDGYIMAYNEKDRNTHYFRVGGLCGCISNQEYLVQKEPVEEAGNWQQKTASKQFTAQTKWRCIVNKHHLARKN